MMKLGFFFLWVSFLLSEVSAVYTAAPYQLLYLYYAYKIEFTAMPVASRTIAKGCTHERVPGSAVEAAIVAQSLEGICTFGEFTRHIIGEESLPNYTGTGSTIDPDSSVADDLPQDRTAPQITYNSKKILPLYDNKGVPNIQLKPVINGITDAVQLARNTAAKNSDISAKLAPLLTKAIGYARIVAGFRIEDTVQFKKDSFNKFMKQWVKYLEPKIVVIFDLDGEKFLSTYTDIDTLGTIDNADANADPPLKQSDKDALLKWSNGYGVSFDKRAMNHLRNAAIFTAVQTRLSSSDTTC